MARYYLPRPFEIDGNGRPLAGALLYFFEAGTSTPLDTYSDSGLTTPNTNPVVADSNGRFPSIFMADAAYKIQLKTASDVTIWTDDNYHSPSVEVTVRPSGGTIDRYLQDKLGEVLSVRDFGAMGDGVTDDTAAFQAAAAHGGRLAVPDGSYVLTSTVTIDQDGVEFAGSGTAAEIWQVTAETGAFIVTANSVTIRGLTFRSLPAKTVGPDVELGRSYTHAAIMQKEGDYFSVDDCRFYNWTTCIGVRGSEVDENKLSKDLRVRNCYFEQYDFGLLARLFDGCRFEGCYGVGCEDTTENPAHMLYVSDRGVARSKGLIVKGNIERDNTSSSSYKVRNVDGGVISGNITIGCPRGIELGSCVNFNVSDNVLDAVPNNPDDTQQAVITIADSSNIKLISNSVLLASGADCWALRIRSEVGEENRWIEIMNLSVFAEWTAETTRNAIIVANQQYVDIINFRFTNYGAVTPVYPIRVDDGNLRVRIVSPRLITGSGTTDSARLVDIRATSAETSILADTTLWPTWNASASVANGGTTTTTRTNGTRNAAGQVSAPIGSAAAPGVAFDVDAGMGMYRVGSGVVGFAAGNTTPLTVVTNAIRPLSDNTASNGGGSNRWSTIYAATGAINTSDGGEKQWRGPLSPAELRVAERISRSIGVYQWLNALALKGEGARLHVGPTAQAVAEAFTAEGLDPARYALWCVDDLFETVEVGRDDNGNPIMAEIPLLDDEGRQQTRQGLRPDQLALFILAAQEARLDAISARLTAAGIA